MNGILEKITRAVERAVEGTVTHKESVPIVEPFRGQTVWQGIVEIFSVDFPPPSIADGWAVESDQGAQYVAVKGQPPADSPLEAVRVWIVSQSKK